MSGSTGTRTHLQDTDIAVVGAGPTGLLLAGDLAAAGHRVTLIERREPGRSHLTRAFGVHTRTLELLDTRGLADRLVDTGTRLTDLRLFGGLSLRLDRARSRFPYLLVTPQYELERLLEERAREAGAHLVHSTELTGLAQDSGGVTLRLRRTDGSSPPGGSTLRAAYAVGADGHRSAVRRALGQPFPGVSLVRSMVLADVRLLEEPGQLLTVRGFRDAFAFIAPFGDGYHRVFAWEREQDRPDDAPVDLAEVRDTVWQAHGTDYGMYDARWLSRFHCDERQVPQYRTGRVFLAGDAAHVHSPAGGQGMNTGLQDAANLGWKLGAALTGAAGSEALLDSYHEERHPVGARVLRGSGALIRMATASGPVGVARRTAATTLLSGLPPLRRRAVARLNGLDVRYPAPRGAHRLVGQRAEDVPLHDGRRLHEMLRRGRFVLVTPEGAREDAAPGVVLAHWEDPARRDQWLVRPDGYLAWAADSATARPPLVPGGRLPA
ncbi:FAD-dependent oxidoreductase [Streptomyces otsuchiensis]|uniref:FAD-dependent oxidoreductase n=1 Tax=Streptomyces otsuchiensis TaxID=2681388 RepID=UPI0010307291|nr:FAD-dependent oxidoreductase [Streptomyces otsuchiensis]